MNEPVANYIAFAVFAFFVVLGLRIRTYRGGPFMFGMQHPRIAALAALVFLPLASVYVVGSTLGALPPDLRSVYSEYLVRVATIGLLCGLVLALVGVARRPRTTRGVAKEVAATIRGMGSARVWLGLPILAAFAVVGEWFNPVPGAKFGLPGMVAVLAVFAPSLIVGALRALFLPSTLPSASEVAAAYLDDAVRDVPQGLVRVTLRDAE
jgi:hypothetical protein